MLEGAELRTEEEPHEQGGWGVGGGVVLRSRVGIINIQMSACTEMCDHIKGLWMFRYLIDKKSQNPDKSSFFLDLDSSDRVSVDQQGGNIESLQSRY